MTRRLARIARVSTAFLLVSVPFFVFAQASTQLLNPLGTRSILDVIRAILHVVVQIGFFIAAFFIIYSGFLFVTAGGNEEKIKEAKGNFLWTVVGVAVLLGAEAISLIIQATVHQIAPGAVPGL